MFCNQCEQAAGRYACTEKSVCGKSPELSDLFDLLVYQVKGIAWIVSKGGEKPIRDTAVDTFIMEALFTTVTNVNFDMDRVIKWIYRAEEMADRAASTVGIVDRFNEDRLPQAARYTRKGLTKEQILDDAILYSINSLNVNQDLQSLLQILTFGVKGLAAYAEHARVLGKTDPVIFEYIADALSKMLDKNVTMEELVALNLKCGEVNIRAMELLNEGHVETFGKPEPTEVSTNKVTGPTVVVSGHDLYMLKQLLQQCDKEGVNVYTHGEMLPAHGYPGLKQHKSLVGHFGTAWQNQQKEFVNQPVAFIFNTNCIQEPRKSYEDRVFTTSLVGWPGAQHIEGYDFSTVIAKAKELGGFEAPDTGKTLMTGFGHDAVLSVADKVVGAVKNGDIKHFFLVGGCDGAKPGRNYFTDLVESAPDDSVVLTLGCGKFRFNHLQSKLGDIGGIPRLLDVGQCNDAYSAVRIAMALSDAFGCGINELPLSLIISWYEQKAVAVLLSLLHLGVKGIRLGPTLPPFITPNVLNFLVENFDLQPIGTSGRGDVEEILGIEL